MHALYLILIALHLVSAKKARPLFSKEEWDEQKTIWPGLAARESSLRVMGGDTPTPYKPTYTSSEALGGECNIEDFEMDSAPISTTFFSSVYKAVHKPSGKAVVIKVAAEGVLEFRPSTVHIEEMLQHDLKHKNIGEVYCAMMPTPKLAYLVLPYFEEGNLQSALSLPSMNQARAMDYTLQLLDVVHFLHSKGIGHFDIKPSNILLTDGGKTIKLIDFGLAAYSNGEDQVEVRGTPGYMAPEIFKGRFGRAADYYAIARTVYALFMKDAQPWVALTIEALMKLNKEFLEKGLAFPSTSHYPADYLIKQLAVYDPKQRWSNGYENYDALLAALSSKFSPMMYIFMAVAAIVVLGAAVFIWMMLRKNSNQKVAADDSQKV